MAAPYRAIREHLDDVVELALRMVRRRALVGAAGVDRAIAELDLSIVDLGETIEERLELSAARDFILPLDRLRTAFQLEATEQRCLWFLIATTVSGQVRTIAKLSTEAVPLELVDELVYSAPEHRDRFAVELGEAGRLARYGLIERSPGTGAQLGRPLRVHERVVELAYGVDGLSRDVARFATLTAPATTDLLIDEAARRSVRTCLRRHVDVGDGPIPVVRGAEGSGRRSLVGAIASELGAQLLVVQCGDLAADAATLVGIQREAILHRAVIVLVGIDRLAEDHERGLRDRSREVEAAITSYSGPIATTAGARFAGTFAPSRGMIVVDLAPLAEAERAVLWQRGLAGASPTVIDEAAARYQLTGGQIEQAARIAVARSDGSPALADVHAGVSATLDDKLAVLGTRIEWRQSWDDLVLPEESADELVELVARIRHKRLVLDDWGFGKKLGKGLGLAALFSGPPGTGKTMAAGLVAQELGLDLYQIDLSRMVSKYVGETEKNLAQVFDAAEAGHAILLFDEADALFSKRTEVKSSVDRYANLEVNYLLQRMEAFSGITILTTNFDSAIDDAFRRRLAFRLTFPLPERQERQRLWRAVIPPPALGEDVNFGELAERFEMSGGYIKNAALRAAYLAAADGARIAMRHLLKAAAAEYVSMGKVVSDRGARGLQ